MVFLGSFDLLGLQLAACDHGFILGEIQKRIKKRRNFLTTPLASQTFVLARSDKKLKKILDAYDYLFSDSLWVKRAINFLYQIGLRDRLRGSNFLLHVCELAQKEKYRVFLYGTNNYTLALLKRNLLHQYPKLKIVGMSPSFFRKLTRDEKKELIREIEKSRADLLLLALGSPLEQVFSYEMLYREPWLQRPMVVIPFGAAFDFVSGVKPVAPVWMQKVGLEWLFRFLCEPRRLWKRYLVYGPVFVVLVFFQKIHSLFNLSHSVFGEGERRS